MSGDDSSGKSRLLNPESVDDALMDQMQAEFDELLVDSSRQALMDPNLGVPTPHQPPQEDILADEGNNSQSHTMVDETEASMVDHLSDVASLDAFEHSEPMPDANDADAADVEASAEINFPLPEQQDQSEIQSSPEEFFADLGQEFSVLDQDKVVHSYSQNPFSDDMTDSSRDESVPVYADLSGNAGSGSNMRVITIVCSMLAITAGVIYWLMMSSPKQSEQLAVNQVHHLNQLEQSEPQEDKVKSAGDDLAVHRDISTDLSSIEHTLVSETKNAVVQPLADHAEGTQLKPVAAVPSPKVQTVTVKEVSAENTLPVTIEKTEADYLAAQKASAERMAMEAAVKTIVVIKPSTPLHKVIDQAKHSPAPVRVVRDTGNWGVFLMSVSSEKLARQLVARIDAMGVHSEIVRSSNKGKVYHRIRIPGFSSHAKAQQQRDIVAKKLRLQHARVVAL